MKWQTCCRTLIPRGTVYLLFGLLSSLLMGASTPAWAIGFTTGYQSLGGIVIEDPSCARASGGEVTCAVVGTDGSFFPGDLCGGGH